MAGPRKRLLELKKEALQQELKNSGVNSISHKNNLRHSLNVAVLLAKGRLNFLDFAGQKRNRLHLLGLPSHQGKHSCENAVNARYCAALRP